MREISTEIQIAAAPAKVWQILTDFGQWPRWNPTVSEASGQATVGSKLNFVMRCEGPRNGAKYSPVVTRNEAARVLRWHAKMLFEAVFSNDKIFELKEVAGGTLLIHKELFSGLIPSLFWSKMSLEIPSMLHSMNKALKEKAELV